MCVLYCMYLPAVFCRLFVMKRLQETACRYNQQSTQRKNYEHLGMSINNVLYCRFSFMDLLDFQLIFRRSRTRFRRYNSCEHSITKNPAKTAGMYIQQSTHIKVMYIELCNQVMYSIVGSHLWIRLIFSSSSRGAGARLRHYNSGPHSITKKPTNNCRYAHTIQHNCK